MRSRRVSFSLATRMKCECANFNAPLRTLQDVHARCSVEPTLSATLETLVQGDWRSILRCSVCGQLWCQEFPFGEMHGGGPPCLYHIQTEHPDQWLQESKAVSVNIRNEAEDQRLMDDLGPEVGPEICRHSGCQNKRIEHAVLCRQHQFKMIKKLREPPTGG